MIDMISSVPAPSCNEEILKKFLKKLIHAECFEDSIGNLVVHKENSGKKVMVICGIDEDSLIALSKENDKIYFNHIGSKKLFSGMQVSIGGNDAYICSESSAEPDKNQFIKLINDEDVETGTAGVIASEFFEDDNYLKGSRIGRVYVINELINLANNYEGELDLYIVFAVQSLFRHKGAVVASNIIEPELVVTFEEIESTKTDLFLVKASKGHISSKNTDEFLKNVKLEKFVDTEKETAASYIKNADVAIIGIPVKFSEFASSCLVNETGKNITDLFNIIFK